MSSYMRLYLFIACFLLYIDSSISMAQVKCGNTFDEDSRNFDDVKELPDIHYKFDGFIVPDIPEPAIYNNTSTYALIINGGHDISGNESRYWNNSIKTIIK